MHHQNSRSQHLHLRFAFAYSVASWPRGSAAAASCFKSRAQRCTACCRCGCGCWCRGIGYSNQARVGRCRRALYAAPGRSRRRITPAYRRVDSLVTRELWITKIRAIDFAIQLITPAARFKTACRQTSEDKGTSRKQQHTQTYRDTNISWSGAYRSSCPRCIAQHTAREDKVPDPRSHRCFCKFSCPASTHKSPDLGALRCRRTGRCMEGPAGPVSWSLR